MQTPNLKEEKKLWKKGCKCVVGLDEAGRGPLAGPVVAAAVMLKRSTAISGIRDSKQLSAKQREELFEILINHKDIRWGTGRVSEKMIDKINILAATKLAMKKAVRKLGIDPDYLILDGNFIIGMDISQKAIKKADQKVFSCAAASIIAKVTRDREMEKLHKKYPQYGFNQHKGYGTKKHYKRIKENGVSKIHRKSFRLV